MASFKFSKKIALRYLWSRRSEAFITIITIISILGIAVGVTVLNIVMSVMTGFEHELREKIVGADSHIIVRRLGDKITDWESVQKAIEKVAGVASVSPFTEHQALIRTEQRSAGILIRGVLNGSAASKQLAGNILSGGNIETLYSPPRIETQSFETGREEMVDLPGILIGRELANSFGILEGEPVSILLPNVTSTPFGLVPKFKRFVIAGIYSSGLIDYESLLAYVSLKDAQRFFRMGDAVSGFEVRVIDVDRSPEISKAIVEALGGFAHGLYARDWTDRNKELWNAIRLEKQVYFIVLLLIVVMASFSIVTTLIMIVLEKRKDVAIMKTMGASSKNIAMIFCIQGSIIGVIGTTLGLVLGYLGCLALQIYGFPLPEKVFQMSTLPIRMEWENFAVTGVAALLISALATVYPAWRASSLEPSEVLRYE